VSTGTVRVDFSKQSCAISEATVIGVPLRHRPLKFARLLALRLSLVPRVDALAEELRLL